MRLAATVLTVLVVRATAHAEPQISESPAVVAAAPVKDSTRWRPTHRTRPLVEVAPAEDPAGRSDAVQRDGKNPVVSVVLPLAVTVAGISVLPVVDRAEFEARGAAKTAWNALGWTGIAAFVIGPSLGQIYAGNPWNTGLKIRLVGAAIMGTGITIGSTGDRNGASTITTRDAVAGLMILAGAIPYVGGSLYEIGTSPRSVRAHNERARRTAVIVVPAAGDATLGVTLLGSF